MSDLLNIGKSGLLAAQAALSTTGHNISNANVTGYTRQTVVQANVVGQQVGYGFIGNGTEVAQVKRIYDNYLSTQVRSAQATTSALDSYASQISQIDNLLADSTSGLSPALQDFFKGVQDVAANPSSTSSRQSLLSGASSLAARFQSLAGRLTELSDGVNSEISSTVTEINSYATQIADLNKQITALTKSVSNQPNDLLDKRDQLVNELNTRIKANVTVQDDGSYNVTIGTGQPLVVGQNTYELAATPSQTDPTRLEVGYMTKAGVSVLPQAVLTGGSLGGLLQYRSEALDTAQNALGRVAIGLAFAFNEQSKLGVDQNGDPGTAMFNVASPVVSKDSRNSVASTTAVSATITDPGALTDSDYSMKFNGSAFVVTRETDGKTWTIEQPQTEPQTIDGVDYMITGDATLGDRFEIQPTRLGATDFSVVMTDVAKIAAAAPVRGAVATGNKGNGTITDGTVDKSYLADGNALTAPVTLTYTAADPADPASVPTIAFDPADKEVVVTLADGTSTTYAPGEAVPYTENAKLTFGGVTVAIGGKPSTGDQFTVGPNTSGVGDGRNMALLGDIQDGKIMDGGKSTLQGVYAQTVSFIGNKTREAQVNGLASTALLEQVTASQQSISGVNLDEEAANLLRYQQAYQASGKVMQIASTLFDTLLSLGR